VLALRHRREAARADAAPWLASAVLVNLGLLFAASVLAGPIHVVGRTDVLMLPWLAVLAGAGLDAIRPRWLGGLAAALAVALAVPSLRVEITSGRRSVDAVLVRSVASQLADGDVLIFAGSFQPVLEWYLPRSVSGVALVGFPGSRDDERQWVDWQHYEREGLDAEAARVSDRALALAAQRGTHAWLLYDSSPENQPLLRALSERARLELVVRYPWEVGLFRIGSPGGR